MLIIMVGCPKSGKSTFIDIVKNECDKLSKEMIIIRPSDWYPPDIDSMDPKDKTDYQLAAWECALDKVSCVLAIGVGRLVVLDTCGATPGSLKTVMGVARLHHHTVTAMLIATPRSVCESRIDPQIVNKYVDRVRDAAVEYNKTCDNLVIVKYEAMPDWGTRASEVAEQLCQM